MWCSKCKRYVGGMLIGSLTAQGAYSYVQECSHPPETPIVKRGDEDAAGHSRPPEMTAYVVHLHDADGGGTREAGRTVPERGE